MNEDVEQIYKNANNIRCFMAISDKTRKLLWGHSGNRCTIGRVTLVVNSCSNHNIPVIGEECYICSAKPSGLRYNSELAVDEVDNYENYEYDDLNTEKEYDVISYFLQLVQDFLDIQDDFEIGDRIKASFEMDKKIRDIEKEGFYVFWLEKIKF